MTEHGRAGSVAVTQSCRSVGVTQSCRSVGVTHSSNSGGGSDSGGGVDGDRDVGHSVDGGVDWGANLLHGVGAGLVHDGLVDGLVGTDGAGDLLGAEGGDVLENGLGHVVGVDDGGGLVGGDRSGNVGVGCLSHWVGKGGDLRDDLGKSVRLSGRVGEVATQPVVLDRGRVVGGGADEVRRRGQDRPRHRNRGGPAEGDQSGEKQEGLQEEERVVSAKVGLHCCIIHAEIAVVTSACQRAATLAIFPAHAAARAAVRREQ